MYLQKRKSCLRILIRLDEVIIRSIIEGRTGEFTARGWKFMNGAMVTSSRETLVSSNATAGSALAIINAKRRCETCARLFPRVCRNEFTLAYYNVNSRLARARVINSISFCHAFCAPPPLLPRQIEFHSFMHLSVLGPAKKTTRGKNFVSFRFQDIPLHSEDSLFEYREYSRDLFELLTAW